MFTLVAKPSPPTHAGCDCGRGRWVRWGRGWIWWMSLANSWGASAQTPSVWWMTWSRSFEAILFIWTLNTSLDVFLIFKYTNILKTRHVLILPAPLQHWDAARAAFPGPFLRPSFKKRLTLDRPSLGELQGLMLVCGQGNWWMLRGQKRGSGKPVQCEESKTFEMFQQVKEWGGASQWRSMISWVLVWAR